MFGFFSFYSILIIVFTVIYVPIITGINKGFGQANYRYFKFVAACLLILSGFRGESVGGDLEVYIPLFQSMDTSFSLKEIAQDSVLHGYEVGYFVLCKLIRLFTDNSRVFLVITSLLSLIGPLYFINKFSVNKGYSILLYLLLGFYNASLNNIRQAIAISVVMIAISFLLCSRKKYFFLLVMLASLIHTSAVFSILFYPLHSLKYSLSKTNIYVIVLIGTFVVFGDTLFQYFLSHFFVRYLDAEGDAFSAGSGFGLLAVFIFVFLVSLIIFEKAKKNIGKDLYNVCTFIMYSLMVAVFIQLFATKFANLTRLTTYFYLPVIVLLPNIINYIKSGNERRLFYIGTYVFFFILMCFTFLSHPNGVLMNSTDTIPYVFGDNVFSW